MGFSGLFFQSANYRPGKCPSAQTRKLTGVKKEEGRKKKKKEKKWSVLFAACCVTRLGHPAPVAAGLGRNHGYPSVAVSVASLSVTKAASRHSECVRVRD